MKTRLCVAAEDATVGVQINICITHRRGLVNDEVRALLNNLGGACADTLRGAPYVRASLPEIYFR